MKRALSLFLIFILLAAAAFPAAAAGYSAPVDAASAILLNTETGSVLFAKNASGPLLPGSSALLMTALVTAESLKDPEAIVTVDLPDGSSDDGRLNPSLGRGEQLTARDLLACILLNGSSQAAGAAARAVSYTEESFVMLMNGRAASLGMTSTLYTTTDGSLFGTDVFADNQTTTVNDFLKLTEAVYGNELLSGILALSELDIKGSSPRHLTNANSLVTGEIAAPEQTPQLITGGSCGPEMRGGDACFTVSASVSGVPLLCVLLGGSDSASLRHAAEGLLDYGGGRTENIPLRELLGSVPLVYTGSGGAVYSVSASFPDEEYSISDSFDRSAISVRLEKNEDGTGIARYYDGEGNELAEVPVTFTRILSEGERKGRLILNWALAVLTLFLCVVLIFGLMRFYDLYQYQRQKRRSLRLDGAAPVTESTRYLLSSFGYHFPLWALWGVALILVVVIALCFNLYPS